MYHHAAYCSPPQLAKRFPNNGDHKCQAGSNSKLHKNCPSISKPRFAVHAEEGCPYQHVSVLVSVPASAGNLVQNYEQLKRRSFSTRLLRGSELGLKIQHPIPNSLLLPCCSTNRKKEGVSLDQHPKKVSARTMTSNKLSRTPCRAESLHVPGWCKVARIGMRF